MIRRALLVMALLVVASSGGDMDRSTTVAAEAMVEPRIGGQPSAGATYESVALTLPMGHARQGRQAFVDLGCATCHRVTGEADLPAPVSDNPGPELGPALAARPTGAIATAIVAPSHSMSLATSDEVKARIEGVLSPMGDYSHAMTVRQLLDLLAYLDSLNR
ncbi:MAG: c-type cytochrome [Vicinamibacterales bacterium]|jgi:mono/diheme cytochrome c family protein|nr:c-type cytochrome [Vicinamibacterales bacterium]